MIELNVSLMIWPALGSKGTELDSFLWPPHNLRYNSDEVWAIFEWTTRAPHFEPNIIPIDVILSMEVVAQRAKELKEGGQISDFKVDLFLLSDSPVNAIVISRRIAFFDEDIFITVSYVENAFDDPGRAGGEFRDTD